MAKDIGAGTLQWSGNYLVDPWDDDGIARLEDFPRLCKYFKQNSAALKARHTAKTNSRAWYRTIDRVTHSLTCQHKLYVADIHNTLELVLDRGETYPHHNLYYIQSEIWDLEVLGGLLISSVGQFFVESYGVRMRGGYLRYQAQYLRRIRIPAPSSIPQAQQLQLRDAFRSRDREAATDLASAIYDITASEMEKALEHR